MKRPRVGPSTEVGDGDRRQPLGNGEAARAAMSHSERLRVAGIEAIAVLVMFAGGVGLTRVGGFVGLLGLSLIALSAMGLAHGTLLALGIVSLPGEEPDEGAQRERADGTVRRRG